jgi:positive regulator of sigma E activity
MWDLVCATLVVSIFFGLSFFFGQSIAQLFKQAEVAVTVIVLLTIGVIAFIALKRYRRRLLEKVMEE